MTESLKTLAELSEIASFFLASLGEARHVFQSQDKADQNRRLRERIEPLLSFHPQNLAWKARLDTPGAVDVIRILIIDPEYYEVVIKEIRRARDKEMRGMAENPNRSDRDVEEKRAERLICEFLNRIRRRNDGEIPDGECHKWWVSYRCSEDWDY